MRGLAKITLAAAAVVAFFWWLGQNPRPAQPPPTAAASTPATAPAPVLQSLPQPAQPAARPSAPDSNERIQALARQARLAAVNLERQGASGVLSVTWSSDNTTEGVDFAETLRREGLIRMFDVEGTGLKAAMGSDGRRQYTATFKVSF